MIKQNIKYPINEYFLSIQGEGSIAGQLALFLRFAKCNLRCGFCDSSAAFEEYEYFSLKNIECILKKYRSAASRLVITGGEPVLYDLTDILRAAKKNNYKISVETNGTLYQSWLKMADWITVSPKEGSSLNEKTLKIADELKFVIRKNSDLKFIENFMPFNPAFLMPVNNDVKIAELILNYLEKNKFNEYLRIGIQMHKVYGIK